MTGETIEKLVIKIQADVEQAQRDLNRIKGKVGEVEGQTTKSSKSMVSSMTAIKAGVLAAAAAFTALSVKAGLFATTASKEIEEYVVSLNTMYGSQAAAAEQLQWILDFAKSTPFEVAGLVDSSIKLKAFGLEAQEVLEVLGDTAAATSKPIDQVVNAYGRLNVGDKGQAVAMFRDIGINLKNIEELEWNAQGSLVTPLEQAMPLVKRYLQDEFGGLMEAQSKTAQGLGSNIQDAMYQAGLSVMGFQRDTADFREGSLFMGIKESMQGVLDTLDQIDFTEIGKSLESSFGTAKGIVGDFAAGLEGINLSIFTDLLKGVAVAIALTFQTLDKYNVFEYIAIGINKTISPISDFYNLTVEGWVGGINLMIDAYNELLPVMQSFGQGMDLQELTHIDLNSGVSKYMKDAKDDTEKTKESVDELGKSIATVNEAASSAKIPDWAGKSDYIRGLIEDKRAETGIEYNKDDRSTHMSISDIWPTAQAAVQTPEIPTIQSVTQAAASPTKTEIPMVSLVDINRAGFQTLAAKIDGVISAVGSISVSSGGSSSSSGGISEGTVKDVQKANAVQTIGKGGSTRVGF